MQKIIEKTKQAITNIATTDPTKVTDLRGPTMTMRNGAPIPSDMMSQTAGPGGPILLQDIYYVEKQAAHNRERIPERVVHAKGAGAYGTFTVTGDITKYTMADLFSSVGKETPVFVRFSRAAGGSDSADTARDVRGFAVKFYTNEGNWDLAGNNHPVFFVRDPIKFMDVIHTLQKDPRNGTGSPIPMWDFFSNTPESLHHVTMFFSDKGTPMSYRTMDGFGANTFSFINKEGEVHFFKIHMITEQGNKVFTKEQAGMIAGQDPDFYSRDLYEAIMEKNYPKWKVYVQVMTPDQARQYPPAFDVTKVWNHDDFPLIEVGMLELNRNPTDFFAEVEQAAFAPSNVVPGISFSPDRILQGRLFAYPDTQRYRIGVNYPYLPVNCPHFSRITSNQKDGRMLPVVENKFPHYYPNTLSGPSEGDHMPEVALPLKEQAVTGRFNPGPLVPLSEDEDFFKQPRDLFNLLPQDAKERLADNIATSLETVPENIVKKQMELFFKCDEQYGRMVQDFLQRRKKGDMQRTEAEWVKSASLVLLKNPNMKDDLLPQGPIGTWPKQYQKFELKSSYESETVPASAPSLTEKLSEKLTGLAK